jgi:hypothetical protein
MTDGTNHTLSVLYNSRLQTSHFDISGNAVGQNYDYYNDGRIRFVHNTSDATFDRSYGYDHLTRLTVASSGGTARSDIGSTPYQETFGYDVSSNLTGRETEIWNTYSLSDLGSYTNNRRDGWGYDADGRNTAIDTRSYSFDAAGRTASMNGQQWIFNHYNNVTQSLGYDGDGAKVRETTNGVATYYLRARALEGAIVEELASNGAKNVGYVYSGGELLATQSYGAVNWKERTPAGTSEYLPNTVNTAVGRTEFDPLGADVALTNDTQSDTGGGEGDIGGRHFAGLMDARYSDMFNLSGGCTIDGMAASCGLAMSAVNSGGGEQCPDNECTRYNPNGRGGLGATEYFHSYADGNSGYLPQDAKYLGDGTASSSSSGSVEAGELSGLIQLHHSPQNITFDLPGIVKLVDLKLADADCAKFADTILNQLSKGKGGNLPTVLNAFLNQSKQHELFTRDRPEGSFGEATALGKLKNSTARMFLRTDRAYQTETDADNVIQELFHFAGNGYNDRQLAEALNKTIYADDAQKVFPDGTANIFDPRYIPNNDPKEFGFSAYFHTIAHLYCGYRPANTRKNYQK